MLRDWAVKNGVALEIEELTDDEGFILEQMARGELDACVTMDSFGAQERAIPVTKIGASEYYFAVNKERPDLLRELNAAMTAIQDEDPYFNQRMFDEYVNLTRTNAFLPLRLEEWLADHGPIRVGYWEDYLPFCGQKKSTGELTGALKDYLAHASHSLKNADVQFETRAFATLDSALAAMKRGEIDCVFPLNLSSHEGETRGILTLHPIMKTEMSLLARPEDRSAIAQRKELTVAVDRGNTNFETMIREDFPEWTIVNYPSVEDCFRAVAAREVDGILACSYRMGDYEPLRTKYKLAALPTGETMELSFAVNAGDSDLYAVLNKLANLASSEDMEYALVAYMYAGQKISFLDFLEDNWLGVVGVVSAVFIVIIVLLIQKLKAERRAGEQQRLLEEAAEIAELKQTISSLLDNMPGMNYTKDAETGVYLACNQAFAKYADKEAPKGVVGHTDQELFDEETAARFAEDDRMALSMNGPYIFFEDVRDASNVRRQMRTTKLKYTDAAGRLCVLGICQDVTDTVRVQRESATTKEAYEKARSAAIIYTHIAQALAQGYGELYYVNLNTEEYIEYRSDDDSGTLSEVRRGWHFFEHCQTEAEERVYAEDREAVLKAMDRKTLIAALDRGGTYYMTYRLVGEREPQYISMKITRMKDDDRYIIMGVTDVDEQMKERSLASRVREEQIAYARVSALAGDFLCIYIVDPETGSYRVFSATAGFESFSRQREGRDFFADSREQSRTALYPEDQNRFLNMMTLEKVLADVERRGFFTLSYRLMMEGKPRYVQLKAVMLEEQEGPHLIVGLSDIDSQVRQEEEYVKNLTKARIEASVDALTGVKNRHAYLMAEERLNAQIAEDRAREFAIVVLDVNDLKKVNDSIGHEAGDQLLRSACKIVCETFKHSPVFRVGGDEFTVIAQGGDYAGIQELMDRMERHNRQALADGGIVIACGMAKRAGDETVATVFERADQSMYENKSRLKSEKERLKKE